MAVSVIIYLTQQIEAKINIKKKAETFNKDSKRERERQREREREREKA